MGDRWGRCKPQAGWVRRKDRRALSNRAIATAAVGGVGGGVVSDEVKLHLNVQMIKQA